MLCELFLFQLYAKKRLLMLNFSSLKAIILAKLPFLAKMFNKNIGTWSVGFTVVVCRSAQGAVIVAAEGEDDSVLESILVRLCEQNLIRIN
jgi:hypothetical protein